MSDGQSPPTPPGSTAAGKRPAVGLQIKLPCATLDDVKARYGDDLRQNRFFVRTRQPRAKETLVRLDTTLSTGAPCFRAVGLVARVQEPSEEPGAPDAGMEVHLFGADDAARDLIASLGGSPPPPLKAQDAGRATTPTANQPVATPPSANQPVATPPVVHPAPEQTQASPAQIPAGPDAAALATKKGPTIGIDLGTTNSCAAVMRDGKPFVLPSREGYNTIPSIVALSDKGRLIVGHPAKSQLLVNPANTVFGAKRLIGRAFRSPIVSDLVRRVPYRIIQGPKGEAAVQLGDKQLSLQQISALVLGEVKDIAQQSLKTEINRAVITVPAYYNDNQRQAVREAGELAGLRVERILNEPTAAALAFAHGKTLDQRVLVYDLGGGTFDASVLELRGNVYEVVSTGGDTFLGGVDFDKAIVDHLLGIFREKQGVDFPGDRVALQRVADAAERAKVSLSEQLEVAIKVPFVALVGEKPYDLEATLTRAKLVELTANLVDRTVQVCQEVLGARGLKPSDLDEVLLVGGQSRMPLVRERLRGFFGKEPSRAVHPDEAVALGAAVLAHSLESPAIEGVVLIDVLPMSIGVGLPGGRFRRIIDRNTSLPHKKQLSISTTRDDQRQLEIVIFQGEDESAQKNEYLGTLVIPGLPRGPRGGISFEIVFALSPEAILTVSAQDRKSGRTVTANFTTRDTPELVKKRLGDDRVVDSGPPPGQNGSGVFGWIKRLFGGPEDRA